MAKNKDTEKGNVSIKKLNKQLIEQKLEEAFADIKAVAGKKFEQSIRKAGKVINGGLSKKTFEKLRKAKESNLHNDAENVSLSHTSINDLP